MTVWHLQHDHAGDDILEVPLGWMFSAVVSDYDMISKIRARQSTRNRLSIPRYYLTKGRGVRVRAGSVPPKTVPHQPPTPFTKGSCKSYLSTPRDAGEPSKRVYLPRLPPARHDRGDQMGACAHTVARRPSRSDAKRIRR